jgi:hypothetical protein
MLCRWIAPIMVLACCSPASLLAQRQERDDEIVTSLSGGRVIIHATRDAILFAAIDQPVESGAAPPRLVELDGLHVGVLFGASEWRSPADPKPIRMDRNIERIGRQDPRYGSYSSEAEADLETMGAAFLEKLRPLVSQLRHKLDFPLDQPILEMVVIGYGPKSYGPEVWTVEFRIAQEVVSTRGDYWQTRALRPRFTQIYPPEKHAPKTLVEASYPPEAQGPTLQTLIEGNDPRFSSLRSEAKLAKLVELISKGQAQKAATEDSTEFLRAAVPLLFPKQRFFLGKMEEQGGFSWILPPEEPVEKAKGKPQQPEAPSLRKRPTPER